MKKNLIHRNEFEIVICKMMIMTRVQVQEFEFIWYGLMMPYGYIELGQHWPGPLVTYHQ